MNTHNPRQLAIRYAVCVLREGRTWTVADMACALRVDEREVAGYGEARMSAKFTPGPWGAFHGNYGIIAITKGKKEVVKWTGFDGSDFQQDNLANAHLIAAAPDMYEVLKSVDPGEAVHTTHRPTVACNICRARRVLAKAEVRRDDTGRPA